MSPRTAAVATRLRDRIDERSGPLRGVEHRVRSGPLLQSYYALAVCAVLLLSLIHI